MSEKCRSTEEATSSASTKKREKNTLLNLRQNMKKHTISSENAQSTFQNMNIIFTVTFAMPTQGVSYSQGIPQ